MQLCRTLNSAVLRLPLNLRFISVDVGMNYPLDSPDGSFSAVPDIALALNRQSGKRVDSEVAYLGECAFSQDQDALELKLQNEIDAFPNVLMAMMIVIQEDGYRSPKEGSRAWNYFLSKQEAYPYGQFMDLMTVTEEDSQFLGPVTVASHPWSRISAVDYYVWVKDGDQKIDIQDQSPEKMARGVSGVLSLLCKGCVGTNTSL